MNTCHSPRKNYLSQLVAAGESSFDNRDSIQLPTSSQKERDLVKDLTGVEVIILNSESAADLGEMISGVSPEHVGRTSERFQGLPSGRGCSS